MAQTQSIKQKLDLRRAVTSSAFVMILLVAVMGLFALFSIWSINRAWTDGMARSTELRELSTAALEAQVSFKVQVQEWKNILLRGEDEALLAKHHQAFTAQSDHVRSLLATVSSKAAAIGFAEDAARAQALTEAHDALTTSYETTLARVQGSLPTLSATAARSIDQQLRGADRALESGIGALAEDIGKSADQRRAEVISGMSERYAALRWFIISIILGAIAITAYVLFGVLRATRG